MASDFDHFVSIRLLRGDQEKEEFVEYQAPYHPGQVVLDVVLELQASQANDLAVRWNCKAGKCGSCAAEINGLPKLMCMTKVSSLKNFPITIEPLRSFPLIKDLVSDVSFNYQMASKIAPFTPSENAPFVLYQKDVERSQEFRKCIECFICQDICHVIRDHPENKTRYGGPRNFVRAAEMEMHPLDKKDRRIMLKQELSIGLCNITKCCTESCPVGIRITDNAIIPLKERIADINYDPLMWLWNRIKKKNPNR